MAKQQAYEAECARAAEALRAAQEAKAAALARKKADEERRAKDIEMERIKAEAAADLAASQAVSIHSLHFKIKEITFMLKASNSPFL